MGTKRSASSSAGRNVRTRTSTSSTRIDVVLFKHCKIALPVDDSTTIADLKAEALRRALALNLQIPSGDVVCRLDVTDGPMAFDDDLVLALLPKDGKPLCWLGSVSDVSEDEVYIRWITPSRALDHTTLNHIGTDRGVSGSTTIKELRAFALEDLYNLPDSTESPIKPDVKLELFLTSCGLRSIDDKETTLDQLGCVSSQSEPLDIFVVPFNNVDADNDRPQTLWGFESTNRGIATFQTCLKGLMGDMRACSDTFCQRILKTLFYGTHFPPALEALQIIKDENKLIPRAVAILASCFRELAIRMVPGPLIGDSISAVLQGSRQIFAWLEVESRLVEEICDQDAALVREIQFKTLQDPSNSGLVPADAGKKSELVDFEVSGVSSESEGNDSSRRKQVVSVQVLPDCRENLRTLAIAAWGTYEVSNYYIDFTKSIRRPLDHRKESCLTHEEFHTLLEELTKNTRFRLAAPAELDSLTSNAITLSEDGYISQYITGPSTECGSTDRSKSTWNAVSGLKDLSDSPEQEITTALAPIIKKRKADGTWKVDDWSFSEQANTATNGADTKEAIVIVFDLSGSMYDKMGHAWTGTPNDFTKFTELKQVFENVVGRMWGYQLLGNFVGCVPFSSRNSPRTAAKISRISKGDFHDMMGNNVPHGRTALWDALLRAANMLISFKAKNPIAKLRIIAMTDGVDTNSRSGPAQACRALYNENIVVDSIVIGGKDRGAQTKDLFRISKHTGGYAFHPSTRPLLFQIVLLEPFLDISARPDIVRVPMERSWSLTLPKRADMANSYDIPPCRKHVLEDGGFISLQAANRFLAARSTISSLRGLVDRGLNLHDRLSIVSRASTPANNTGAGISVDGESEDTKEGMFTSSSTRGAFSDRTTATTSVRSTYSSVSAGKIYLSEISQMLANVRPMMDVYVCESDMSFWKVVLTGPANTPYAAGTFMLTVHMTDQFPQQPPVVRFATPILHANISKHGRICHGILQQDWRPTYHVHTVLGYIQGELLTNPEKEDVVDELATMKFWTDAATAEAEIGKYVAHFAGKTREQWRTEILGTHAEDMRMDLVVR